jgi:hypothetical protein
MKAKHTPGPWKIAFFEYEPNEVFVQWPHGYAAVHGSRAGREANARLIAVAPDLLAALNDLLPYTDDLCDAGPEGYGWQSLELEEVIGKARAAISKATGQTE